MGWPAQPPLPLGMGMGMGMGMGTWHRALEAEAKWADDQQRQLPLRTR
jgi:hypothetical protein